MTIKINEIPPEGLTLTFNLKLDLFDGGSAPTECTAVINIKPLGGEALHITGSVSAKPTLECSRCLKAFIYPVDADVNIDLVPTKVLGMGTEHELGQAELDTEFYQGDELNPLDIVKEQILIAIPMVPLHRPDCKGLCPVCGKDLNAADCGCQKDASTQFGAFSSLKDILNKKKEH